MSSLVIVECDQGEQLEILTPEEVDNLLIDYDENQYSERVGQFFNRFTLVGDQKDPLAFALLASYHECSSMDQANLKNGNTEVDLAVIIFAPSEEVAKQLLIQEVLMPRFEEYKRQTMDDPASVEEGYQYILSNPIEVCFADTDYVGLAQSNGSWVAIPEHLRPKLL